MKKQDNRNSNSKDGFNSKVNRVEERINELDNGGNYTKYVSERQRQKNTKTGQKT